MSPPTPALASQRLPIALVLAIGWFGVEACVGKISDRPQPEPLRSRTNVDDPCTASADVTCNPLRGAGGEQDPDDDGPTLGGSGSGEDADDLPLGDGQANAVGGGDRNSIDAPDDDPSVDEDEADGDAAEADAGAPEEPGEDVDDDVEAPPPGDAGADAGALLVDEDDDEPEPPVGVAVFAFAGDDEGWALVASDPAALLDASSLAHDPDDGFVAAGSLRIAPGFTAPGEQLASAVSLPLPLNLEGRTLAVSVRLEAGVLDSADAALGARLEVRTGPGGLLADGGTVNLTPGAITRIELELNDPTSVDGNEADHDPGDVRAIGLRLVTGQTGDYQPGEVRVDDVVAL